VQAASRRRAYHVTAAPAAVGQLIPRVVACYWPMCWQHTKFKNTVFITGGKVPGAPWHALM
jgi:hypothetical protein